jgi:hypothetical protein
LARAPDVRARADRGASQARYCVRHWSLALAACLLVRTFAKGFAA